MPGYLDPGDPSTWTDSDGKPLFSAPPMPGLRPLRDGFVPEGCDDPYRPAPQASRRTRIGDRVVSRTGQPRFDGPGVVQNIGPKNTTVLLDGNTRAVRIPHDMLTAADAAVVTAVPMPPPPVAFTVGQLVRWGGRDAASRPGLYVVIGFGTRHDRETTKVAVLGGNRNKWWAAVGDVLVDANGELPRS